MTLPKIRQDPPSTREVETVPESTAMGPRLWCLAIVLGVVMMQGLNNPLILGNAWPSQAEEKENKNRQSLLDGEPEADQEDYPFSEYLLQEVTNLRNVSTLASEGSWHIHSGHAPSLINMPPDLQALPKWRKQNFPNVNIIAMPKAGTSHLYEVLVAHPEFSRFGIGKESCFGHNPPYPAQSFFDWNAQLEKDQEALGIGSGKGKMTVNACLQAQTVFLQHHYIQPDNNTTKFIMIFRDPADWLWAAYNFWHIPVTEDAIPPQINDWASPPYQYRSPEQFHELMLAGGRSVATRQLFAKFRDNIAIRYLYLYLDSGLPRENLLVLKAEDMTPDRVAKTGTDEKIANFLGVSKEGFDPDTLYSYGNCGDNKGANKKCKKASSAYAITGNRTMLSKTRPLVYLHFARVCQYWWDALGVEYPECLAVAKKNLPKKKNL